MAACIGLFLRTQIFKYIVTIELIGFVLCFLYVNGLDGGLQCLHSNSIGQRTAGTVSSHQLLQSSNRKLLELDRVGESCTAADITVLQGETSPLPNGIPTYTVQIFNLCSIPSCTISNIHVACGWFASAKLINPKVFRRVQYNDCVVNDGNAIGGGDSISFEYANSFQYSLTVLSVETCT